MSASLVSCSNTRSQTPPHITNMENFINHLPVKIRFGEGISKTLPAVIGEVSSKYVFLMVDAQIEKFNPAAGDLINELKATLGLTVFLITHDLDTLRDACDRVAALANKHIDAVGPLDYVRSNADGLDCSVLSPYRTVPAPAKETTGFTPIE